MMKAREHACPLLHIIGIHITTIVFDMMHCMDLGLMQFLIPSLVTVLVKRRRFRGATVAARDNEATRQYRRWCSNNLVKPVISKKFTKKKWSAGRA